MSELMLCTTEADAQDDAELKTQENTIKKRPQP